MKLDKKFAPKTILSIVAFCGFAIGAGIVFASPATSPEEWNIGYRINSRTALPYFKHNKNNSIVSPDVSNIEGVVNFSSYNYFIPSRTLTEWNAFCNNASGVTCAGDQDPLRGDFSSINYGYWNYTCNNTGPNACGGDVYHYSSNCSACDPAHPCAALPTFSSAPYGGVIGCRSVSPASCLPGCKGGTCADICASSLSAKFDANIYNTGILYMQSR